MLALLDTLAETAPDAPAAERHRLFQRVVGGIRLDFVTEVKPGRKRGRHRITGGEIVLPEGLAVLFRPQSLVRNAG